MRICSGYFCAGLVLDDKGIVKDAAPIIRYMMGWTMQKVINYCKIKKWKYN